jgi:cell division initiation protein
MSKIESLSLATVPRKLRVPEPNVGVMPDDVRQARFASAMRGYDRGEVAAFLDEAADAFEQVLRQNEQLRATVVELEASNNQFLEIERNLKNTLMSAQKVADDMCEKASADAARIVSDAEDRAELLLRKTEEQLQHFTREIDRMASKRHEAEATLERTISTLQNTLAVVRGQVHSEQQQVVLAE